MCKELKEINWEPLYAYTDVNPAWCFIKNKLTTVFNGYVPFIEKQVKDRFCPCLSSEICQQINNRDKAEESSQNKQQNRWEFLQNFMKSLYKLHTGSKDKLQ